jgi:hypothetical protein
MAPPARRTPSIGRAPYHPYRARGHAHLPVRHNQAIVVPMFAPDGKCAWPLAYHGEHIRVRSLHHDPMVLRCVEAKARPTVESSRKLDVRAYGGA